MVAGEDLKEARPLSVSLALQKFDTWRKQNNIQYQSQEKLLNAILKFSENNMKIDAHNKLYREGKVMFKQSHWKYSDLSLAEKRKMFKIAQKPIMMPRASHIVPDFTKGPASVDWNAAGLVSPSQDQGQSPINQSY